MIHGDNPFVEAPEQRDPVRRFRGRLPAAVTIVTAGHGEHRTGLTVSSLNIVEGDPGSIHLVVGPTSDLWDVVADTGSFIVHVCRSDDRHLAETFAGMRPSPGGPFAGLEIHESSHGPVIQRLPDRASCRYLERSEIGYTGIVVGTIDSVSLADSIDPLVYFRGRFRELT